MHGLDSWMGLHSKILWGIAPHTFFCGAPYDFCIEKCSEIYKTELYNVFLFHFPCTVDMFCYGLSHWPVPDRSTSQQSSNLRSAFQ